MMTLFVLLVGSALAQTPPAKGAPAPAPAQAGPSQASEETIEGKRVVADSDVFGVKNLAPTFDWSARESFLPRVIDSVEHGPF